ncbi:mitochondrial carrier domain-containing protein [Catenaria anguillulae PL171]|uniref:Mitochondrial carrier domain-containing protein n=1 Tax=Catenaria anguillulae PL171 TaxID=765915 RepID=A0A1Y2I5L2_9FUNG|nr:mitochondrial carrier domain-containing protein [Catenaria anguillulae PL171]
MASSAMAAAATTTPAMTPPSALSDPQASPSPAGTGAPIAPAVMRGSPIKGNGDGHAPQSCSRSASCTTTSLAEATVQRLASASFGSILTSLLVTPLDVVKTRMQQQPSASSASTKTARSETPPLTSRRPAIHTCPVGRASPTAIPPSSASPIMTCCREVFFSGGREVAWFCTHHRHTTLATVGAAGTANGPISTTQVSHRPHPRNWHVLRGGARAALGSVASHFGPRSAIAHTVSPSAATTAAQYSGTWNAMVTIARTEGITSLWRGLTPTLVMALPANVIYFVGYEWLKDQLAAVLPSPDAAAPLIAGGIARTIAVTTISPIELVRTQMQSAYAADKSVSDILKQVSGHVRRIGPQYLWRGLSATLARDVPFSAMYWATYEALKRAWTPPAPSCPMLEPPPPSSTPTWFVPFAAGACAGMLAAAVTTPLDVAKTRRQLNTAGTPARLWPILKSITAAEGVSGLFAGLVPRVAKVAPACAIMIGTYEYGKEIFAQQVVDPVRVQSCPVTNESRRR